MNKLQKILMVAIAAICGFVLLSDFVRNLIDSKVDEEVDDTLDDLESENDVKEVKEDKNSGLIAGSYYDESDTVKAASKVFKGKKDLLNV